MSELKFEVVSIRPELYAAMPSLVFRLRIEDGSERRIGAMALKCQLRIEPQRRTYDAGEAARLDELFGDAARWGDTVKPFLWTHVATVVTAFDRTTEVDLVVPCSYDMEVASATYFRALGSGAAPIVLLFNGSVFYDVGGAMNVEPIAWDCEANAALPVAIWRELMDHYYPGSGWLRLQRETLDALRRFKARQALPTWDSTLESLLDAAGEGVRA
jgi:hypothetical protein